MPDFHTSPVAWRGVEGVLLLQGLRHRWSSCYM